MPQNLNLRPLLPFLVILILMTFGYLFAYSHPFSWTDLKILHMELKEYATLHPVLTPLLFMAIYILYALLSLPGIFVLSLLAGFLFNQPFSTLYVTVAATIGASLLFLATRSAFGFFFYRKVNQKLLNRMERGFHENATSYLLFLRLIPLFPFFIVNIAGAFFAVPLWMFVWTTFIGMLPSVFVYTQAGKGLTVLLHSPDPLNPISIFNPPLIFALLALALLSLFPILFKRLNIKL